MVISGDKQAARHLTGKTIAKVEMNPFSDWAGRYTNPVITFEDGSFICFVTQETEGGDYGTSLVYGAPPKKRPQT